MNNEKPHSNNFWSGFSLGILTGGALMYVFATKRGRKALQNMLEHSDTIEGNLESILQMIQKHLVVEKDPPDGGEKTKGK